MESKRKDLEIVYHLQWKNNGDNKMSSSIVGMYDIPSTTLNWDTFKSYLLKNSGTTGDDVKVSYIIDDKEFSIESQIDFQIALYSFRNRARMGEIINLKLDRIIDKKQKQYKSECVNAQTQVEPEMNHAQATVCPPDWFRVYMNQFKKEVVEEVTANVVGAISKPTNNQHYRKIKAEPTKRSRKHAVMHLTESGNDKELLKSFKLERKLENKLEKLEHKTLKIKEKKQALSVQHQKNLQALSLDESDDFEMGAVPISLNNVQHVSGGVSYAHTWKVINNGNKQWDSNTELRYAWGSQSLIPVNKTVTCPALKPHEEGTITIVLNTPITPGHYECYWHFYHNNRRFGHWLGCQVIVDEEPFDLTISGPNKSQNGLMYPCLETTSTVTCLSSPPKIDVAEANVVLNANVEDKDEPKLNELQFDYSKQNDVKSTGDNNSSSDSDNQSLLSFEDTNSSVSTVAYDEFVLVPMTVKNAEKTPPPSEDKPNNTEPVENIQNEEPAAKESDDNNNNTDNFVVVNSSESSKIPESSPDEVGVKVEDVQKTDELEKKPSGYAFVVYKGQKLPVPKKYLHSDYLATAEDAPDPKEMTNSTKLQLKQEVESPQEKPSENKQNKVVCEPQKGMNFILGSVKQDGTGNYESVYDSANTEAVSYASHCSAAGSCFSDNYNHAIVNENETAMSNSRLFVFPSNCPGFEVVHPQAKSCNQCSPNERMAASGNASSTPTFYYPTLNPNKTPQNHLSYTIPPANQTFTMFTPPQNHISYTVQPRAVRGDEGYQSISGNCQVSCSNHNLQENVHVKTEQCSASGCASPTPTGANTNPVNGDQSTVHILPETLVTGAVNVASSAINTARSVLNMIVPTRNEPGVWVNGHWVAANPESPREAALRTLSEMGFWDRDLNATLLARYNDDLARVVTELVK